MSDEFDEIWSLYADDGGQALYAVEEALLELKVNPTNAEAIAALFRAMHTFKGNSRLLGLTSIETCAHLAEDLIGLVRDEGVDLDAELHALLLEATDVLRAMMETTIVTRRDADPQAGKSIEARMREKCERCASTRAATADRAPEAIAGDGGAQAETIADESCEAILFDTQAVTLADDPLYRELFLELAHECLAELRDIHRRYEETGEIANATLLDVADRLRLAAEQIGIGAWPEVAADIGKAAEAPSAIGAVTARMNELYELDAATLKGTSCGALGEPPDPLTTLADRLEPLVSGLIEAADVLRRGEVPDAAIIRSFTAPIEDAAELLGYVRLLDTASRFPDAVSDKFEFHRLLFELYADLKLVEEISAPEPELRGSEPRASIAALGAWCAEQVPDVLNELRSLTDVVPGQAIDVMAMENLLQRIHHGRSQIEVDVIGSAAIGLADGIARIDPSKLAEHELFALLQRFVANALLLIEPAPGTAPPDTTEMAELLQRVAEATSLVDTGVDAQEIETRLGLPPSFLGNLTSASAEAARVEFEAGKVFHIVRADFAANEDIASRFMEWINGGAITIISSVTVFERDRSLFDFLVASPLDAEAIRRAIATIDPDCLALRLEASLGAEAGQERPKPTAKVSSPAPEAPAASSPAAANATAASTAMLETIGEIVTGHSAMRHLLSNLDEEDLFSLIDAEVRARNGDWSEARAAVRAHLQRRQEAVAMLGQLETQMASLLDHVQAETIAARSMPASSLLDPLAAYGQSVAAGHGRKVSIATAGGDIAVDMGLLEAFDDPLRRLVAHCIEPASERDGASSLVITLAHHDDHIAVTVVEDRADAQPSGSAATDVAAENVEDAGKGTRTAQEHVAPVLADIESELRAKGGGLRQVAASRCKATYCLTLPLAIVVLDGMVVRVGSVSYVVPIHAIHRIVQSNSSDLVRVSAGDGSLMLKLSRDDILPVSVLSGCKAGPQPAQEQSPHFEAQVDHSHEEMCSRLFVVAGQGERRVALAIDELVGQQMVFRRPLKGYLSGIRGVTGCALLGSGSVGMVLDVRALVEQV